jgi:hypothetical protein
VDFLGFYLGNTKQAGQKETTSADYRFGDAVLFWKWVYLEFGSSEL